MTKFVFIYERQDDFMAPKMLKELLGKMNNNVSLYLEISKDVKTTLTKSRNAILDTVLQIKKIANEAIDEKVTCLKQLIAHYGCHIAHYKFISKYIALPSSKIQLQKVDKYLDNIREDFLQQCHSLNTLLEAVKLAESKGIAIYPHHQPYNNLSFILDHPLYAMARHAHTANKLIQLCDEASDVIIVLLGLNDHPVADILRNQGISTSEYYVAANLYDNHPKHLRMDLRAPESVTLIDILTSSNPGPFADVDEQIATACSRIIEESSILVQESVCEEGKEEYPLEPLHAALQAEDFNDSPPSTSETKLLQNSGEQSGFSMIDLAATVVGLAALATAMLIPIIGETSPD